MPDPVPLAMLALIIAVVVVLVARGLRESRNRRIDMFSQIRKRDEK